MSDVAPADAAPVAPSRIMPSRGEAARAAALVVAGGWAGYFLFTGMPQLTLHVFPRTIALHATAGGMALAYLAWLAVTRRRPGGTPLDAGVLAMAGAYALATWGSIAWRPSLETTLQTGVAVIAFYALSGLPLLSAQSLRRALALAGAALAVYALWVVGNDYAQYLSLARRVEGLRVGNILPPTVPRVHDVSDHPNVLAMLLTLVLPMFALSAYRGAAAERTFGVAALVAGGMAMFLTLSRSGWLGGAAGVALTLAGAWATSRLHERQQRGDAEPWRALVPAGFSPTALAAVTGAVVLLAGGTLAFLANASTRPGWLFRGSLSPREDAWRAGWHVFADHPWLGAGPNAFGLLYPEYARGDFLVHTQHAHNGFLQLADDAGLVGLAALAVLAGAVVFALCRTWARGTLDQRLLAVACAGALAGFVLQNQLDAANIWKAPAVALAFVGAIIARNYVEATDGAEPVWRFGGQGARRAVALAAGAAVVLVIVAVLAGWYRIDRAHYAYWRGAEAANEAKAGAEVRLQEAVDDDSSMTVYQLQLGQVLATQYELTHGTVPSLIERAVVHLQRAVELDPRSDLAHANLAKAYQLAGEDDRAAEEARTTRRIARYHVAPVLAAGEVYEALGRTDDAIETYAQVISMDAGLADSAYWQGTAFRRAHFDEILRRSGLGINPCTEGSYLVQARRSDASRSLAGLDEASRGCQLLVFATPGDLVLRVEFARILAAQGRRDEAFGHLEFAVKRQPDFGPARTELGRWYYDGGEVEAARRQWVVGGELDEPESLLLLGQSYGPGEVPRQVVDRLDELLKTTGSSIENDVASVLYYRMRYGRLSPVLAMIPGDWQTAVPRLRAEMQAAVAAWRAADGG